MMRRLLLLLLVTFHIFIFTKNGNSEILKLQHFTDTSALKSTISNTPFEEKITTKNNEVIVQNLGIAVNSPYADLFPSVSHNDSSMVFTHHFGGIEEDFYTTHKDSCGLWNTAKNMGYPPNSGKNESSQTMSIDGNYLFFTRCGIVSQNGWASGGCDLYFSFPAKGIWQAPVPFGATINSPSYEGMPSICPENKILYFVSNREGGLGGLDIWSVSFSDGQWQLPVNLGPEINTDKDDIAPFICTDNLTLFYASNGKNSIGGMDIFVARRSDKDAAWNEVKNIGKPYNTEYDEINPHILSSGEKMYFSSNRPGAFGSFDIYEANLVDSIKPQDRSLVSGFVIDAYSLDTVTNAQIQVEKSGKQILELYSNKGDGSFFIALEPNIDYKISVRRFDYPLSTFDYRINVFQTHPSIDLVLPIYHYSYNRAENPKEVENDNLELLENNEK